MHKLEQIRKKLQITKTEMAVKLGMSKSNYSMIIHGQQGISKKVALKIYEEFGVPLEELLRFKVQPEETNEPTGTEGGGQTGNKVKDLNFKVS